MRIAWLVCALFAIAGCEAKHDRCKEVVAPAIERSLARAAQQSAKMHDRVEILEAIAVWRCGQDKWSSDALDCYNKATSPPELRTCRGKLLADQADALQRQARLAGAPTGEDALAKLAELRNAMCACKAGDKDCAQKVLKELQDHAEHHKDLSDEEMKEATEIAADIARCSSNAMGSDAPRGSAVDVPF